MNEVSSPLPIHMYSAYDVVNIIYVKQGLQHITQLRVGESLHTEFMKLKEKYPGAQIVEDEYLMVKGHTLAETDPKYKGKINAAKIGARLANDPEFLDKLLSFQEAFESSCYSAWLARE